MLLWGCSNRILLNRGLSLVKITFLGVRGTSAVTEPRFQGFGGETTSVKIEGAGGERIFIDAGTGIRAARVAKSETGCLLLLTHYHLDHVMGLPHLAALYDPQDRIAIASPRRAGRSVEQVITRILANPFWPVPIGKLPARIAFRDLPEPASRAPFRHGGLLIRWAPLHHPGGSTAYRVDETATGSSFVFATDVEWAEATKEEKQALIDLSARPAPAKVLAMDGQYTRKTYTAFRGWGHSAWEDAVEAADLSGAPGLIVTHHNPSSDDRSLAAIEAALKKARTGSALARQGMRLAL